MDVRNCAPLPKKSTVPLQNPGVSDGELLQRACLSVQCAALGLVSPLEPSGWWLVDAHHGKRTHQPPLLEAGRCVGAQRREVISHEMVMRKGEAETHGNR